ncbi:HEAT repeat domain-containing protein [Mucilaginibacter antarcticus]|uniref:HEAT repeat domain-containing protein n=1 Tax=Mucilaginibacter antarcticus TaxID=1855725 RepID=UPI003641A2A3
MNDKADTLTFKSDVKPDLVNVDGDKILLAKKNDSKTLDEYVYQYFNAPLWMDRMEAITAATPEQGNAGARKVMLAALKDKYFGLRIQAIKGLTMGNDDVRNAAQPILMDLAKNDANTLVRASAISVLGKMKAAGMMTLFNESLKSQSYAVQGAAVNAILLQDPQQGLTLAKGFESDNKGALTQALVRAYATAGGDAEWPFVSKQFNDAGLNTKFALMPEYAAMAGRVKTPRMRKML